MWHQIISQGATFFRHFGTVAKGANFAIFCVLRKIEDWIIRNGIRPERLYLQCDGGPDNANKYMLAMCELLVSRKIVKSIVFTRYSYDSFNAYKLLFLLIVGCPLDIHMKT